MAFILTKKHVIAIGAVAYLAIAGLGYNYVVSPSLEKINIAQEDVDSAQTEVDTMQSKLSSLQTAQSQFAQVQSIDSQLAEQFPSEGGVQDLLNLIITGAAQSGIPSNQVSAVNFTPPVLVIPTGAAAAEAPADGTTPAPAATAPADGSTDTANSFGDGFAKIDVTFSATGSAQELKDLLDYLNKMPRVLIITQATVSGDDGNKLVLAVTAKSYLFRSITIPSATPADGTGNTTASEDGGDSSEG